jgi:hypothetical protein
MVAAAFAEEELKDPAATVPAMALSWKLYIYCPYSVSQIAFDSLLATVNALSRSLAALSSTLLKLRRKQIHITTEIQLSYKGASLCGSTEKETIFTSSILHDEKFRHPIQRHWLQRPF